MRRTIWFHCNKLIYSPSCLKQQAKQFTYPQTRRWRLLGMRQMRMCKISGKWRVTSCYLSILSVFRECTCSLQATWSAQLFQSEVGENLSLLPITTHYSPLEPAVARAAPGTATTPWESSRFPWSVHNEHTLSVPFRKFILNHWG